MILNKKDVRRNKSLRRNQKIDRKENRDRKLDNTSVLKRNVGKIVQLSSEELLGKKVTEHKQSRVIGSSLTHTDFIDKLKQTKLTGMSGNGFLVADKISTYIVSEAILGEKIIIVNAVECEPALYHDVWLLKNKATEIRDGLSILHKVLTPNRIILATRGKKEWELNVDQVEVKKVPLKYPMGEEHMLIHQLTGVELANDCIPASKGILMINVQTVYQIYRIFNECYDGGHYVTLANLTTGEARVAYVDEAVEITRLLEEAFGQESGLFVAGGGITSAKEIQREECFTNTINFAAILKEVTISNETPCKKCGGCSKKCPVGISVKEIVLEREKNQEANISKWKPERCIHCQTCTYFCMAGKDVASYVSV